MCPSEQFSEIEIAHGPPEVLGLVDLGTALDKSGPLDGFFVCLPEKSSEGDVVCRFVYFPPMIQT